MADMAHFWVRVLVALLGLMLSAGWVLASIRSASFWEMMFGNCLFLFGNAMKMSMIADMVLVSSLTGGNFVFSFAFVYCF